MKNVVILAIVVALAGCSESADTGPTGIGGGVGEDPPTLAEGKGGIAGVLLDDRFRPIDLEEENANGEFQAIGFILLQETGQRVQTDERGEFGFLNLDPGEYKIRSSVQNHDVGVIRITVEEGLLAEARIIAQRVSSESSIILTEEYSGFTPCAVATPAGLSTFGCNDSSGDSYRTGPDGLDYTALANLTYMVVEMKLDEDVNYVLEVRDEGDSNGLGPSYLSIDTGGTSYARGIIQNGALYGDDNSDVWDASVQRIFVTSFYAGEDSTAGSGVKLASKSQFFISLFIGEPEVDLETYTLF